MTMITMPRHEGFFARLTETLRVWALRRETRAELERLSERELADIGLSRADISDVVARTY
ncbi:MAG: DUF1127 domain-containing protein [Paracoccus sp. (in: a-proteobacteria)]|nr:DUF1127 domain-containing protein [Paracoccus sp. (in: a-proteobacteria)]